YESLAYEVPLEDRKAVAEWVDGNKNAAVDLLKHSLQVYKNEDNYAAERIRASGDALALKQLEMLDVACGYVKPRGETNPNETRIADAVAWVAATSEHLSEELLGKQYKAAGLEVDPNDPKFKRARDADVALHLYRDAVETHNEMQADALKALFTPDIVKWAENQVQFKDNAGVQHTLEQMQTGSTEEIRARAKAGFAEYLANSSTFKEFEIDKLADLSLPETSHSRSAIFNVDSDYIGAQGDFRTPKKREAPDDYFERNNDVLVQERKVVGAMANSGDPTMVAINSVLESEQSGEGKRDALARLKKLKDEDIEAAYSKLGSFVPVSFHYVDLLREKEEKRTAEKTGKKSS
ncbi:MAG: hypothetical protein WCT31_03620, partial [Candidatus Micrarchaeia archaeon]